MYLIFNFLNPHLICPLPYNFVSFAKLAHTCVLQLFSSHKVSHSIIILKFNVCVRIVCTKNLEELSGSLELKVLAAVRQLIRVLRTELMSPRRAGSTQPLS